MDMQDRSRVELEERIHSLLCGDLSEKDRREILLMISRDEQARETLREMLDVQRLSRAAFGYDNLDETIARTMPYVSPDSAGAASATGPRQCRETQPKGQIFRRLIGSAWPGLAIGQLVHDSSITK